MGAYPAAATGRPLILRSAAARTGAAIACTSLLAAGYAHGAWPLGFVAWVPWIVALHEVRRWRHALLASLAMCLAYVAAVFGWFAGALREYTQVSPAAAMLVLLAAAPLLQPQIVASALARRLFDGRRGRITVHAVAIAAWVGTEWAVPRLFGDTWGQGLQPSTWLRQGADVAGAAGLTAALLVVNEALALAVLRWRDGMRATVRPALVAAGVPLLLALYGVARLSTLPPPPAGTPLRFGLVQASIVDYERLRRDVGAYAVVRRVLDVHEALSRDARARGADVVVWPETVYPTTFGRPKSADGQAFDDELSRLPLGLQAPLVFGTYDRDAAGEYNAAAFVDLDGRHLGSYRKTRLFPLTERVPDGLDSPALRRALPWAGTWRAGDGARVFPVRTPDGREVPVAPLICRDDVEPSLAIDAARLGAQVLVGLSNDSWFTKYPQGARLHLQVAAFRSIETRLPQVRATTNGLSAAIDDTGEITARSAMGAATVLMVHVVAAPRPPTLMLRLGDWLGPVSLLVLFVLLLARFRPQRRAHGRTETEGGVAASAEFQILLLRPWQRGVVVAGHLVAMATIGLLGFLTLVGHAPGTLWQIRLVAVGVVVPTVVARGFAGRRRRRLRMTPETLEMDGADERIEIPRASIAGVRAWRLPFPAPGLDLWLARSGRWAYGIAAERADVVRSTLAAGEERGSSRTSLNDSAETAYHTVADHPAIKFGLFPLLMALPAFRLHQLIAYGGAFGEYYTFGAKAYLLALALWWAQWAIALMLVAFAIRAVAEGVALGLQRLRGRVVRARCLRLARWAYFLGVPAVLLMRLLAS